MPGVAADRKQIFYERERDFQTAGSSDIKGNIVIDSVILSKRFYRQFERSTKPVYVAQ
jgi:hypothetical protein